MQKDRRIDRSACTFNTFPKGRDLIVAIGPTGHLLQVTCSHSAWSEAMYAYVIQQKRGSALSLRRRISCFARAAALWFTRFFEELDFSGESDAALLIFRYVQWLAAA